MTADFSALELPSPPDGADPANEFHKSAYNAALEIAKERVKADLASAKATADAQIALEQSRVEGLIATEAATLATEDELQKAFHADLAEVAKASLERSRAAGEFIQKAAGAIATLYTGVLAVSFSVADRPLPARGAMPAIFLGLAIALSSVYVGYLTKTKDTAGPTPHSAPRVYQLRRSATLLLWIRNSTLNRVYWLRASVVSLGMGVLFLPIAFVAPLGDGADGAEGEAPPTATPAGVEEGLTDAVLPPWPSPSPAGNIRLQREVFAAMVAETAAARQSVIEEAADETETTSDTEGELPFGLVFVGLLAVFLGPLGVSIFTDE